MNPVTILIMRKIIKIFIGGFAILFLFTTFIYLKLKPGKLPLSPEITFLQNQPVVDGLLDENLKEVLPKREYEFRFNLNIFKGSAGSNYRLAYGTDFIYLYLEAKADSFICRDRGYQNGDGFILTLSNTKPESDKTDEHYVMGFSSQYVVEQEWARKILWNYNGKVSLTKLPDDVLFEYQANEGLIGFELVIPWSGIYPYHPFLSDKIGFNLWFMKAHHNRRFPNVQGVSFELPSETGARRYKTVEFEQPELEESCQSFLALEKNHCNQGEKLIFKAVALSSQLLSENFEISIYSENEELVVENNFNPEIQPGLSINRFELVTSNLIPGNYRIEWLGVKSNSSGTLKLSVLPRFDYGSVLARLENAKEKITAGSYTTMLFYIQEIRRKLKTLKDYEDFPDGLYDISLILDYLEKMELGKDTISSQSGIFRRAFRSDLDNTLQPYKVQVPDNYDKNEKYPLIVFLHGSGKTDEDMFSKYHRYLSEGDFIQIAPYARGVSHYYGTDKAQFDIKEAIQNAIVNYSVDTSNIVLTGFSMGGYGVYRSFIEAPYRYKGLAIFSGVPKVGLFRKSGKGEYPNFLKQKNYEKLNGIPIFIYHGENDLNCPFELTNRFVGKLNSSEANVVFIFDEGTGHSSPDDAEILAHYYDWLNDLIVSK